MGVLETPKWLRNVLEHAGHFSEAGMAGIMSHPRVFNTLGEAVGQGAIKPEMLDQFLLDALRSQQPVAAGPGTAPSPTEIILRTGPQKFWTVAWNEILGENVMKERKIIIPPLPTLKAKTKTAMTGGLGMWIPIFLPEGITESDYPADFIKPAWGKYLTENDIQRRPLPGRWVMVETIPKPNWDDQNGYGNGNDPLAQALGLATRLSQSWDDLHETHLPLVAKAIGLSKKSVRLTTAEEWQWIAYVFFWLNTNRSMNLPNLGSTNSWEWCENSCGGDRRLIVGYRGYGGLADVNCRWHGGRHGRFGFRVLAVL